MSMSYQHHQPLELPSYSMVEHVHTVTQKSSNSKYGPVYKPNALQGTLKFQLHNDASYYTPGQVVSGCLEFIPPLSNTSQPQKLKISELKVTLEGVEKTDLSESWSFRAVTSRKLILGTFCPQPSELEDLIIETSASANSNSAYCFPFALQLADFLDPNACKNGNDQHLEIPPSLGQPDYLTATDSDVPGRIASIVYHLRASVHVERIETPGKVIKTNLQKLVRILPNYEARLSLFEKEKFQFTHKLGKPSMALSFTSWKKAKSKNTKQESNVEVTIYNPSEVPFQVGSDNALTLTLAYSGESHPPLESITSSLLATTECYSALKNDLKPTKVLEKISTLTHKSFVVTHGKICLPVTVPALPKVVPSFESCFVERRYALNLQIKFADGSRCEAEVPVRIGGPKQNLEMAPPAYIE